MWLITGGSGQLAMAIAAKLREKKVQFISLNRKELDIRDFTKLDLFLDEIKPAVIVNCAAWTDVEGCEGNPDEAYEINSNAVLNLALKSRSLGIKLVQISSDYVFGGEKNTPWKTFDLTSPGTIYGKSKARAEEYLKGMQDLDYIIVRSSWIYSPWGTNFPKKIMRSILHGVRDFNVVVDQVGQPTNAYDLASQIMILVEKEIPMGTFHITNSGSTNWFEFAKLIVSKFQALEINVNPIMSHQLPFPISRPKYSVLDCTDLEEFNIESLTHWDTAFLSEFENINSETVKEANVKKSL